MRAAQLRTAAKRLNLAKHVVTPHNVYHCRRSMAEISPALTTLDQGRRHVLKFRESGSRVSCRFAPLKLNIKGKGFPILDTERWARS